MNGLVAAEGLLEPLGDDGRYNFGIDDHARRVGFD
jgi:hypothetical protein